MKSKPKIAIVDYGVGNLRSLIRAFIHFGAEVEITEEADRIAASDAVVLPGDGAFKAGMDGLKLRNLTDVVLTFAKNGKPVFGICLGAQILLSDGYEFGHYKGLNLIPGKVVKFPRGLGEKIPQIGWNELLFRTGKRWRGTILDNVSPKSNVYFIHSYIMEPDAREDILAVSKYGKCEFASVISRGNIWGCQFHPEKSGPVGLSIIGNFIKIAGVKHE